MGFDYLEGEKMKELVGKNVWVAIPRALGYAGKILKISNGIIKIQPANKNHKVLFVPVASIEWMVEQ
jgi:hypothetical protein